MRKIAIILFMIAIITGCSVFKYKGKAISSITDNTSGSGLSERIRNSNISKNSFFIQKADIQISGSDGTQKFLCTLKFELPDKYLISFKSKAGIEALRVYLSRDTILINDRINKKLYAGRPQYLNRKFGISLTFLPLILGDFFSADPYDNKSPECKEGKTVINGEIMGLKLQYILDCEIAKAVSTGVLNSMNQIAIQMKFNKFLVKDNYLFPRNINVVDIQRHTSISIQIDKILLPWEGKIEFIPGYGYELVQLL